MGMFSFLNRWRTAADNSGFSDGLYGQGGLRATGSAMRVSPDSALTFSAVYACVRILSETFAVLPFVLYRVRPDGSKQVVRDHYLYPLFSKRPNAWQTAFEWREMIQGHLALRGNAYNRIVSNARGEITALIPLHPDSVRIEITNPDSRDYRYRVRLAAGAEEIVPRGEIWHLRGLSSDGYQGLSPIALARESISLALTAQKYGVSFYANNARPSAGWVEFPGKFADKTARQNFREQVQEAQSGLNRGKIAVLDQGMKYHDVGISNEDAQFLDTRKFQVAEIARWFRIPPHMIADLEHATFSNIEHQGMDFITHTMTPWAERWESSIEANLLLDGEELEVEFDFSNYLRGDHGARADYYASGIQSGWLTRNEARLAENLNPLEGLDEPLRPLNMVEESDAELAAGEETESDALEQSSAPALPVPDARLSALARSAAERVARKEVELLGRSGVLDEKHSRFIAAALGISVNAAADYCADMAQQLGLPREEYLSRAVERLTAMAMKGA